MEPTPRAPRPRLLVVTMARNEADIIESFVRHHLALADAMHVLVHVASDATAAILERLVDEGLPLTFECSDNVAFNKGPIFAAMTRRAIERHRPDFVLPLDVDEFVRVADRETLERELADLEPGSGLWVPWRNYVPCADDPADERDPARRIRHRREREARPVDKVFFAAATFMQTGVYLSDGQHHLGRADGAIVRHVRARAVTLAHFPVRSAGQFVNKIAIGWLSRRLSPDQTETQSTEWRQWFDRLRPRFRLDRDEFATAAAAYLGTENQILIDDPLPRRGGPLRHTSAREPDALQHLVAFAERVVESSGRAIGAHEAVGLRPGLVDELLRAQAADRAELLVLRRDAVELARVRARLARAQWRFLASVIVMAVAVVAFAFALTLR